MRFIRENCQMANKMLYREDVFQVLFADSDSEGGYLLFGNDDRPSNDRASSRTSLHAQWCRHAWRECSRNILEIYFHLNNNLRKRKKNCATTSLCHRSARLHLQPLTAITVT